MKETISLIDCTLRDGHQSLLATRVSTEQSLRVLPDLASCGYRVMELWGGATLDAGLRFVGDDPWQRLEAFRATLDDAPQPVQLRSLCRGQNLFGYNPYPDNVICEFLKEAMQTGSARGSFPGSYHGHPAPEAVARSHRIRIFDALNDHRNLITAIMATKAYNGHAEAAMSYTVSPVHDEEHFLRFARRALEAGADSLAIKDMAGLLHPADAWTLIEAIRGEFPHVELTLHSHCTNGLATASYVVGMLAGVDHLDTCHGPFAHGTAQPPVELVGFFADELGPETNLDRSPFGEIDAKLREIREELAEVDKDPQHMGKPWPRKPTKVMLKHIRKAIDLLKRRSREACDEAIDVIQQQLLVPQGYPAIDKAALESQIPGGMVSNLHHQLKEQGQLDKLPEILEEVARVRKAAGYVPLVTPTSQIIGTQAAMNVIVGKPYSVVSQQFRDVLMGKYGHLPGPIDDDVMATISDGQMPFDGRPADKVPDIDLKKVFADYGDVVKSHRDLLLVLLFPIPAKQFLAKRSEGAGAGI